MIRSPILLLAAAAGVAALGIAATATAASVPFIGLASPPTRPTGPPTPADIGITDGWLLNGVFVGAIDDASNFTGLISSGIADGTGIALQDHDLFGTESGNPALADSDYFYVFNNVLY